MDDKTILNIIEFILYLILGGFALYFKTSASLKSRASSLIAEAEALYCDTVKTGGRKHKYVVDRLYSLIPVILKPVFTREIIGGIVDNTFSSIEDYAKQQLKQAEPSLRGERRWTDDV